MIRKSKFVFVLSILIFISSCKTQDILISEHNISASTVTQYEGKNILYKTDFLRFDFRLSLSPSEVIGNSLLQVRATFIKDGKLVGKGGTTGSDLVINFNLGSESKDESYSAFLFKSLAAYIDDSFNTIPIGKLDYDELSIVIVHPVMASNEKYRSNVVSYTKEYVNNTILNTASEKTFGL